jgi:hypothetical protein
MTISSEIASLNADIAGCFNSVATFTPATGTPVSLRCELVKSVNPQPSGYDGLVWEQQTTIEAVLADLPRQPNKSETFTINGVIYSVKEVIADDGYFVRMAVK